MSPLQTAPQYLLSLPPAMARDFPALENRRPPGWFSVADPAGSKLGSGGGVAHLLASAWRETGDGRDFEQWLHASKKLLLMAGGQSRRLPAYAAPGKILLPFKALRGVPGQRLDQTLLDVQLPAYEQVLQHAPASLRVLVTSGDVLLRFASQLPAFPEVDVLGLGMWVKAETAADFGVFFSRREDPAALAFFLQKPSAAQIRAHSQDYRYLVDTGMWLLSARALRVLLARCGWDGAGFAAGQPGFYELYAQMGLSLGSQPTVPDAEISALSAAVVPLPEAEFYHLGTSRQLIESMSDIENRENVRQPGWTGRQPHPDQHVQNSPLAIPLRRQENHTLWIENSTIPATWTIASEHVLTGIPPNDWPLALHPGQCLDIVAVGAGDFAVRPYHIDDRFKGALGDPGTLWLGASAGEWFARRGLDPAQAGIDPRTDIQQAAIFPVVTPEQLTGDFVQWTLAPQPAENTAHRALWLHAPRISAEEICNVCNLERTYRQRHENLVRVLGAFIRNHRWNAFYKLDLQATANTFAPLLEHIPDAPELDPLDRVHEQTFRAAVQRRRGRADWQDSERAAFRAMNDLIVRHAQLAPVHPGRHVLDDQIIWARSPVRLDLAGGWSDTPPYCIEYGGAVLNLAVNLNGQPPIQVFAKMSERREIVLRSIDLGVEKRLTTYAEIDDFHQPESDFALAKAALALAGFLPRFHSQGNHATLAEQLRAFGGGIELSLLSAVPKGSGLGTSSILAATVLGALGELCGLGWDKQALFRNTLALEQLLTTGGGWQDQAGGIHYGVKLIETAPGLEQKPVIRWLPEHLFNQGLHAGTLLLYYTGITRLAKNILQEIVRGLFLNSRATLDIIDDIRRHALHTFNALQTGDGDTLAAAIRQSWELNQRLDGGTNPPAVQAILDEVAEYVAGAKLLGAGGGGYLLIVAKDEEAARRLRRRLTERPLSPTARFVDFSISQEGMAITKS